MSHRGGARTPSERNVVSPSPARDALQGNLESNRTVTNKRSWFGSARSMISRHVSSWKTEEPKTGNEENVEEASNGSEDTTSIQQENNSSHGSTTPLRPRAHRTFTPKNAVSSLRQHIHSSRGGRKRGALADITGNERRMPIDPGSLAALEELTSEDAVKTHARKNSLGRSLVGSIRTLGSQSLPSRRISPSKRKSLDQETLLSPTRGACDVPLPSSPIPIAPPPALQLDLGPAALVTSSFGRSPVLGQREELMNLTSPGAESSIRPVPTYYTRIPGEGPSDHAASLETSKGPFRPSDLLRLPVDEFGFSLPSGPTTPMPNAGTAFELDGSHDPSEIFERSLEYKDKAKKKEDRKLKKMVSLDAMAEECAARSPAGTSPSAKSPRHMTSGRLNTPLRKISGSTVSVLPEDMAPLTRQMAGLQDPEAGHRDPTSGEWQSEDPFAPSNAVGDLADPASTSKDVKLPFRPKITLQSVDSAEPKTLRLSNESIHPDAAAIMFSDYHKAPANMCFLDGATDSTLRPTPGRTDSVVSNIDGFSPTDAERRGLVAVADTDNDVHVRRNSDAARTGQTAYADADDYRESKTQVIFGDLKEAEKPQYDAVDEPESFDLIQSLRHSPSVKRLYERISKSNASSPRSVRAGTTHDMDVADIFWKSNLGTWIKGSEDSSGTSLPPSPRRDVTELSIDLLSSVDRPTPNPSPTTTTPDRTPMGSRVEFDLKRSNRNMRYNALSEMSDPPDHESAASDPSSIPPAWGRKLRVVTGSYKSKDEVTFSSDGADGNVSDTAGPTTMTKGSRYSAVNMSSDSITADLHDAIAEHYVFQNALAPDEPPTPTASSAQALLGAINPADGSCDLSPSNSVPLWQAMEHGVFDTPPGGSTTASPSSNHHRESQEYGSGGELKAEEPAPKPAPPPEDTLDECLEMFQHFNKFQVLSSDVRDPSEHSDNPFSSPVSESRSDGDFSSPRSSRSSPRKPPPARYRSQRGRRRI